MLRNKCLNSLTFVEIFGSDGEHSVLDVLVLVHFSLVVSLVEIGRIIVLVGNANTDEFGH